ncbi:hypothetical protein LCGC14_3140970, partial [marine sediment metagenome]
PLLLKLLDANDVLSLQVHPDEQAVKELGPPAALKTECWYVLESRNGYILKDPAPDATEAEFQGALARGDDPEELARLVQRYDVLAGAFHYLPAGTLHALGAGVVVAEIQTPSDTTYRVSDWGRGREVHVAEAMRCIHFQPPPSPPGPGGNVLVKTPYFTVRRLVRGAGRRKLAGGQCAAWMVLAGAARVSDGAGGHATELLPGDTVLLPAGMDAVELESEVEISFLEVTLPR